MSTRILVSLSLVVASMLAFAATAAAQSTGAASSPRGPKPAMAAKRMASQDRQGGDTIATATPIPGFPYTGSGTTAGYIDDYDSVCPSPGSTAPDVVYSFERPEYGTLTIDLCGSDYNTKIYVMNADGEIFDCNDNYYVGGICGANNARIDNLWLPAGETYYLVVDGAGSASGPYEFEMRRWGGDDPIVGGGDTILDAILIPSFPFADSGTTEGFTDDYDEVCPYTQSFSPDIVYSHTPSADVAVDIDLCGSSYDTKLYVYDSSLGLVACNDDFYFDDVCGIYVSKLENVTMQGGQTYYIVVDGYGGDFGPYVLTIAGFEPCVVECQYGYWEGEPPLVNDYVDHWNGGCNTSPGYAFQDIYPNASGEQTLCGVSGWYLDGGSNYRDTDWYWLFMGPGGVIGVTADSEEALYLFELGPQDCANVAVIQSVIAGPCNEASMTITGYPNGSIVWFWAGPTVFAPPSGYPPVMFDYMVHFTGLEPMVATESTTWSTVKALYR